VKIRQSSQKIVQLSLLLTEVDSCVSKIESETKYTVRKYYTSQSNFI